MEQLEFQAVTELIVVYSEYMVHGLNKSVTDKAKKVYDEFHPAGTLLGDEILSMISTLFPVAYPYSNSGIKCPTKQETEKILISLNKIRNGFIGRK